MTAFVLIIFAYSGIFSVDNAVSLTTQEFSSRENCEEGRREAQSLTAFTVKNIRAVCVKK